MKLETKDKRVLKAEIEAQDAKRLLACC